MTRWPLAPFSDVVDAKGSGTLGLPQSEWTARGKYPVIGQGSEYIEGWTDRDHLVITPAPAVVLYGGHTRRAKFVDQQFVPGPNVKLLQPQKGLDAKFLYYFLNQLSIASRGYADHFPEVRRSPIPVPPLAEQRCIAAILDKADELRALRRAVLAELDALAQSVFLEMFGSATNQRSWKSTTVGSIANVQGGLQVTPSRSRLEIEAPYLRVANVHRGRLDLSEIKRMRVTAAELSRTRLMADDLLVVEGHGNASEIGRVARWDGSIAGCVHQNHLIRVRLDSTKADAAYVVDFLNSAAGRRHLLRSGKTTSGLNTISVANVQATPVVLPPLDVQSSYASHQVALEAVRASHRKSLASLDTLFASLQHRAFRGEL